MTNKLLVIIGLIFFIFVIVLLSKPFYILDETEQAIITQFGKPIGEPITQAGLHVKKPFVQTVHIFDKRILEWDGDANQIPTKDKKYIWLDTTARWRIKDALKFYQSVTDEIGAQARLDDIIDSAARRVVTNNLLVETVRNSNDILEEKSEKVESTQESSQMQSDSEENIDRIEIGREKIVNLMLKKASEITPQYGIELIDVQIKRINYVEKVRQKVFERMISERERIASEYRSEGKGNAAETKGKQEKELSQIESSAYRYAEEIKGEADAKATKIYAEAYDNDPEFYSFWKTLETYKSNSQNQNSENIKLILTTNSDFYKYLKSASPGK